MDKNSGEEPDGPRVFFTSDVNQSITSLGALPFWKAFWDIIKCGSLGIFQISSLFLQVSIRSLHPLAGGRQAWRHHHFESHTSQWDWCV